jgi:hypothetical protein
VVAPHKSPQRDPHEEKHSSRPSSELPTPGCRNGKGQSDGVHLCYGSKGLIIVYPVDLLKAFGNQSCLIPTHLFVYCLLGPVDPSASDKIHFKGSGTRSQVWFLRRELYSLHGDFPKGIPCSLCIGLCGMKLEPYNNAWASLVR